MIAHRPAPAAPVVRAVAEAEPSPDNRFDAVMAVLSDHLWRDRVRGLRELRRVARRRVVLFNADPAAAGRSWLTRDYLPGVLRLIPPPFLQPSVWVNEYLTREQGPVQLAPVPIPHDCTDGFYGALWRRPAAYLDSDVRAGIALFARLAQRDVAKALHRLRTDLASASLAGSLRTAGQTRAMPPRYYLVIAEPD